jgi:hypothetical protein
MVRKGSGVRVPERASRNRLWFRGFWDRAVGIGLLTAALWKLLEASAKEAPIMEALALPRLLRVVRVSVVARRADAHEPAGVVPVEVVEIVSEPALDPMCIHFRFGDGLGCPSSNREYRDRHRRFTAACGRIPAVSRWHQASRTTATWAHRGPSTTPGHPAVKRDRGVGGSRRSVPGERTSQRPR